MEKLRDTDLTTRRREGACVMAFSPDVYLLPTPTDHGRTMSHSAAGNSQNPDMTILDTCIHFQDVMIIPTLLPSRYCARGSILNGAIVRPLENATANMSK